MAQLVERWALDRKVLGSNPISPSTILVNKMSSTMCGGNRESLLRTNPPSRDVCNLELYSLVQGYRKGMSSSILWLPVLRSINPLPLPFYRYAIFTIFHCHYSHKSHLIKSQTDTDIDRKSKETFCQQWLLTVCWEQLIFTCCGGSLGNVRDAIGFRMTDFFSPGDFNCLQHMCKKNQYHEQMKMQNDITKSDNKYTKREVNWCFSNSAEKNHFVILTWHVALLSFISATEKVSSTNKKCCIN